MNVLQQRSLTLIFFVYMSFHRQMSYDKNECNDYTSFVGIRHPVDSRLFMLSLWETVPFCPSCRINILYRPTRNWRHAAVDELRLL